MATHVQAPLEREVGGAPHSTSRHIAQKGHVAVPEVIQCQAQLKLKSLPSAKPSGLCREHMTVPRAARQK